jgi:HK97 family phage prohead protease
VLNKAWSLLTIKSVDEERRVITGIATTPDVDRQGDIVDPLGAKFAKDLPLFLQHDSTQIVGRVRFGKATKDGIPFEATIPNVKEPGTLKDRVDEAWQSVKYKLITGVSIGFRPVEGMIEAIKTGLKFLAYEILELSLVPIPANAKASILTIKSLDQTARASHGLTRGGLPGASGATGQSATTSTRKGNTMKTMQQLQEERATKAARAEEIKGRIAEGVSTEEEDQEADDLMVEVKALDRDIRVLRLDLMNATTAKGIDGSSTAAGTRSRARDFPVVKTTDPDDEFAGHSFARIVQAKAISFKRHMPLSVVAEAMFGKTHPNLVQYTKAGVAGGGTGSGEWGAELVGIDNRYVGDFIAYLYGKTGFDKLGLREAPRNVAVKGMDGAATANWVGESKSIPVSAPSASTTDLTAYKLAGMCVMSNELLADSSPGASLLVRDALAEAIAYKLDTTFFSAAAVSSGVSPAGILNGLTQIATTGTDAAAIRALINALYAGFISAKNSTDLKLVMSPGTAKAVGLLVNSLGQTEFPGLTTSGGMLLGDMVVTSDNVDPSQIILLKPSDIWRIGDTGIDIALSSEAMVEQDDTPAGASDTPTAASATMMSMFGTDSSAIRAIRRVGWKLRRTGVVAFTDTADFGGVAS